MLHTETVDDNTLELVRKIQLDDFFDHFLLVGGTALSLLIGHRKSVDLDFFTRHEFDTREMLEHLEKNYQFREHYRHTNTLKGVVNGVFIDFLKHDYEMVAATFQRDGIRIASKQDIAAMKVNAIAGNGTRVKDFIDIYFLLKEFSFEEIIGFYKTKYTARNEFHAIKSLTFFDDIIEEEWPVMILEKNLTFEVLKGSILESRDIFLRKIKT